MISLVDTDRRKFGAQETVIEEYMGISTDTKPTLTADRNGSSFYEMDTKNVYLYDGETQVWLPQ